MLKVSLVLKRSTGIFRNINGEGVPVLCWEHQSMAPGTPVEMSVPIVCSHRGQSKVGIPIDTLGNYILFEELHPNDRQHVRKVFAPVCTAFSSGA